MWPFIKIAELFEAWIDPLRRVDHLRPPDNIRGFFWHYIRQAKLAFLSVLLLNGVMAVLEAMFFYFVGRLVDILDIAIKADGWNGLLSQHGGELALMLVVVIGFRSLAASVSALVDEQVIGRGFYNLVRWQSYLYVARQSLAFFSNQFSGAVVTKVSQAGGGLGDFATGFIQIVWTIGIFTITTLTLFAQIDLGLAGIIVAWVVIFALLATYFLPRMRASASRNAEASAAMNGRIVDVFSNIQTVKLFGALEDNDLYMREGFATYLSAARQLGRIVVSVRAAMTLLSGVMIAAIAVLSIDLWTRGIISVGSVAFAMALVLRLNMWLGRLMGGLNGLMRSFGTVQNSMETVAQPIGVVDRPDAIDWVPGKGQISFKHVNFSYAPKREIVEDLSFDIRPGERVGLVGRSGAGKTTIVNLLLRFYDLDSGEIAIDGQDIAGVKQEALRRGIGVVTQDISLLNRTVRENILFGRAGANDEEMIAAATSAGAHEFILELRDQAGRAGYAAQVGERGVKLSGGQRQRIAIARVMLKNAPILVLDEATSALDSEIEAAIQEQFKALMKGKTVIAIAHRLSTIAAMDRLIVIEEGRIVEQGSHAKLLKAGGLYASLWARQSGGFLNEDARDEAAQ